MLVLSGDLDTITASSGSREVARRFPGATFVEVANSVHVTALADSDLCPSWQKRPQAVATLEGAIGGRRLHATMPAR